MLIQTGNRQYGSLTPEFSLEIPDTGYIVFTGKNNLGKSALLQLIFCEIFSSGSDKSTVCYIPKDRDFISDSTQPESISLANFNSTLYSRISPSPFSYDGMRGDFVKFFAYLLNNGSLVSQAQQMMNFLKLDGFGEYLIAGAQNHTMNGVPISAQGSGLRGLMPIYAALSDKTIKYVIIDEPEASLEAGLQKIIYERILDVCETEGKTVIVATHSHLFLNRIVPSNNFTFEKPDDFLRVSPIKDPKDLRRITFQMLGNSLSDFYLPNNYLFVEGYSDQIIVEKIVELLGFDDYSVRVISCGGDSGVKLSISAVGYNLRPILEGRSPYAATLVALLDKPNSQGGETIREELKRLLGERYFQLPAKSLEEYLPESLYEKAEMVKVEELAKLSNTASYEETKSLKEAVSSRIVQKMEASDLENLEIIVNAVKKALLFDKSNS